MGDSPVTVKIAFIMSRLGFKREGVAIASDEAEAPKPHDERKCVHDISCGL